MEQETNLVPRAFPADPIQKGKALGTRLTGNRNTLVPRHGIGASNKGVAGGSEVLRRWKVEGKSRE